MARYEMSEFEWRVIKPLLPQNSRGVPRVDDRRVLNGIFRVLRSGAPELTCQADMARTRLVTIVFAAGRSPTYGTGLWMQLQMLMMGMCA